MGKGDQRTAKGKRNRASFGKTRPRKGKKKAAKKSV
jgi:ribosomal small subunit protein bTHX